MSQNLADMPTRERMRWLEGESTQGKVRHKKVRLLRDADRRAGAIEALTVLRATASLGNWRNIALACVDRRIAQLKAEQE